VIKLFSVKFLCAGLVISIVILPGCSRQERAPGNSAGTAQQKLIQKHTGKLLVSILPETPTSSDDLQAIFTEGGAVTCHWEKNGRILENENTPRLAKSRFAKGDIISVTASLGGQEGKATVTIANSPPEIRSVRFTPDNIFSGVDITAVPDGFDADGDEVSFSCKWFVNDEEAAGDTTVLRGGKIKKGDRVSVLITPSDREATGKVYPTQALTIPKASPRFISTPPTTFRGNVYTYNAAARDPDGDTITYSLSSSPAGMIIDERTGRINWPITRGDSGLHTIEVTAQNSEGVKAFQRYTLNITLQSGVSE